jgi:hypothetical protein
MNKRSQFEGEPDIAARCAAHLEREIDLLEQHLSVSNSIHNHLGTSGGDDDTSPDEWLEYAAAQSGALAADRNELRTALARFLDVPLQRATIRLLLSSLDDASASRIRQQVGKLESLESAIRKLSHTNSLLIRQTMDLYQRIAFELSNPGTMAPTYSPSGELTLHEGASFLQKDC